MHGDGGGIFFEGGFMWVIWILLLALLVVVIRALVGRSAASGSSDD